MFACGKESQPVTPPIRVLIVGMYIPALDGEWRQPLHYFRVLRARGIDAWLTVLDKGESPSTAPGGFSLHEEFPTETGRLHVMQRPALPRLLAGLQRIPILDAALFPVRMWYEFTTQWSQYRLVCKLIREHEIDVVHQPVPQCPRQPSLLYRVGAPVVIGPMTPAIDPPPGFRHVPGWKRRLRDRIRRWGSVPLQYLFPAKRLADILLVTGEGVLAWLPPVRRGEIIEFREGGVDLALWKPSRQSAPDVDRPIRFVCVGRLVATKAYDLALEALHQIAGQIDVRMEIIGTGPMLARWQRLSEQLGLGSRVEFRGWVSQKECVERLDRADIFVHPCLSEPGGTVLLEAMAMGLPIIAADWGGPADRVDANCGILIEPRNHEQFVRDMGAAMLKLARSPTLRHDLGEGARRRAVREFDWERRVDGVLEIYAKARRSAERVHATKR